MLPPIGAPTQPSPASYPSPAGPWQARQYVTYVSMPRSMATCFLLFSFGVAPVWLVSQREHKQDGQCSQADDDYSCELLYGPHKRPLLLPKPVSHVIGSSAIRNYAVYGVAWSGL